MIVQTYGLTKYYGKTCGVEDLDLSIKEGEIFGYLGPNGSGKTTTLRLLLDLIRPTRGRAEIFGLDTRRYSRPIRQRLGYVPGDVAFYEGMTGDELLGLIGHLHQGNAMKREKELAERLDIDLRHKIKTYSKGTKQKLAIIQALMGDPDLLILDEPTLGLDPLMQQEFFRILGEEREGGKTVLLSSHILPEVERVCDRVGILRDGRLVAVEEVNDLKRKKVRKMEIEFSRRVAMEELQLEGVEILRYQGRRLELAVHGHVDNLIKRLAELPVEDMVFPEATLEDTFMKFYGTEEPK